MYPLNSNAINAVDLLNKSTSSTAGKIHAFLQTRHALKFNFGVSVIYEQAINPAIITDPPVTLYTEQFEVYNDTNIKELLQTASIQLQNRLVAYESVGSGWLLHRLVSLDLTLWHLNPLRGSYQHVLPEWVRRTKSVRSVKSRDNQCFKWAVLASLYRPEDCNRHVDRALTYQKIIDNPNIQSPDFSMMTYPVPINDIKRFERSNKISVNVYGLDTPDNNVQGKIHFILYFFYYHQIHNFFITLLLYI